MKKHKKKIALWKKILAFCFKLALKGALPVVGASIEFVEKLNQEKQNTMEEEKIIELKNETTLLKKEFISLKSQMIELKEPKIRFRCWYCNKKLKANAFKKVGQCPKCYKRVLIPQNSTR